MSFDHKTRIKKITIKANQFELNKPIYKDLYGRRVVVSEKLSIVT